MLKPLHVRIAFVVLCAFGGFGAVVYVVLWVLVRQQSGSADDAPDLRDRGTALAVIALAVGMVLLLRYAGFIRVDQLVWPVVIVVIGAALLWRQADETQRARWSRAGGSILARRDFRRSSIIRVVAGGLLVLGGAAAFLAVSGQLPAARRGYIGTVVILVGLAVVTGPWWWRLVSDLAVERTERIRSQERAELAAHLHDSVLQTLALIQRQAGSPREVVRLARGQERELRTWLYRPDDAADTKFAAAIRSAAAEVEDAYGIAIEAIVVGDADLQPGLEAVRQAAREALVNAAKHAGVESVSLYAEVESDAVTVFVRDRGVGFDPAQVPGDRHGLSGSVVGRMRRHGGSATVSSKPGEGTEVELRMTLHKVSS